MSFAQNPKSDDALIGEAEQQYKNGNLADAEQGFRELVKRHPSNLAAEMYLGQTLFREEKFQEAMLAYEKCRAMEKGGVKLNPIQHRILIDQLAMTYGLTGGRKEARTLLEEAIKTDPGYPLNYYNLACVSADEDDKVAVMKNLSLAFQHKDQVLPGEQMPDPASDSSFKKYVQDADFKELLNRLRLHS